MSADKSGMTFSLGMNLLRKLCKQGGPANVVFSPLSLGATFAVLSAGLDGDSKRELLNMLGCLDSDHDEAAMHKTFTQVLKDNAIPLLIATKCLTDRNRVEIRKEFDSFVRNKYEAEVERVDFAADADRVATEVNKWASRKTNGMIDHVLDADTLRRDQSGMYTLLVLINAVYFKAKWQSSFQGCMCEFMFTLRDGSQLPKKFMTVVSKILQYTETEQLRLVKIPYLDAGGCYMVVAIPKDETKWIDDILVDMTGAEMADAVDQLNGAVPVEEGVNLVMPKFKIEFKYDALLGHIQALGVRKIFDVRTGNFSKMVANWSELKRTGGVEVGEVLHRSKIVVNEQGTEACAVTLLKLRGGGYSIGPPPKPPIYVKVSRPFYFAIHTAGDKHRNAPPVFQGICRDPDSDGVNTAGYTR